MSEFVNFLCWDPITVPSSIATEAVSADREVFLATHSPLRINQARLLGNTDIVNTGSTVREEDVLKDFLEARSTTGALLMPIVGGSGSGKSHLVRWVKENIPQSESRKVIYLEKYKTSLRAVIGALTEDAESGVLADLRRDIDHFSEGTSETKLAYDLLDQLAAALHHAIPARDDRHGRTLLGEKGLPVLLHDPVIRSRMLRPDRFIPQLAHQLLEDKTGGEAERPPGFSMSDLPVDIDARVLEDATKLSKNLIRRLSTSDELQLAAVQLLNTHLEAAVKKATNLSGGRLGDAMRTVREEYKRKKPNQEIILLIEDFALIQGVQGDLLDAILEPSTREGVEFMAPIRTMMAVTTGYFHRMDETVLTRIGATSAHVYNLDVTFDDDQGADLTSDFVGRYLNVARLLSKESTKHTVATEANACDGCPFQSPCHDAFGVSPSRGYGLYPFNKDALTRMVHSTAGDDPQRFTPRTVLSKVVIPILSTHADDLSHGRFPSEQFDREFPVSTVDSALPSNLAADIDRNDPFDANRRKTLLTFWDDGGRKQISADLLRAFKMSSLSLSSEGTPHLAPAPPVHTPAASERDKQDRQRQTASSAGLPASLEGQLTAIERWGTRPDSPLTDAEISRVVRGFVARTVSDAYLWTSPITKSLNQSDIASFWWNSAGKPVSIEDANENVGKGTESPIYLKRSPENALLFQEIHLAKYYKRGIAGRHNRRLATLAEEHSSTFSRELQEQRYSSDDVLVKAMVASLIGAALFGRVRPQTPIAELMSALFDDGVSWTLQDLPCRVPNWEILAKQHQVARPTLVAQLREAFGISKGTTGAVLYLDAARVLPLLDRAKKVWTWDPPTDIPKWLTPASKSLSKFPTTVTEQTTALKDRIETIRQFVPRGVTWPEIVAGVRASLDASVNASLPVAPDISAELQRFTSEQIDVGWTEVIAIENDLARIDEATTSADELHSRSVVASSRPHAVDFGNIVMFLATADRWLDAALSAQSLSSASDIVDAASKEVADVVEEWAHILDPVGDES
ncbi:MULTISPECIES: protein DpdH [Rhodococcus]|uniref:Protein DpdH n=1 Tax=Rhodococcus oxybenzonivorans TaxID=1990687 RepID=A0AAE4V0J2_9NOCA|nr:MULTISPECIES: protein DpdH [Rhodococcus]MDV7245325.1 protein DpdH [Rhodococcus oxybenzonivorans]MDV7266102.1 protein DpdH [Rhodococcus oxybenzonivorans]MDV7272395.1 protein DpdH [Rhodococcus oxybenzonivorans]MDV7336350.1 protein DpdH [Rhodococcus oxybenzonivorans]MDV7347650.1 protein DpdH [Rhodococcus oxybenzonivorans]